MGLAPTAPVTVALALLAGCSSGTKSTGLGGASTPVEVLACRARIDSPYQFAEIVLRSEQNLGQDRIADRTGTERHVRLHPDQRTVVFARERTNNDPDSRELFVATSDGSAPELRLTQNGALDDEPCWSPDGTRVLFTSTRNGAGSLWLVAASGGDATPFLAPPATASDGEADWCRTTDRVVFSRRAGNGHHTLWLAQGDGSGSLPLTDGGAPSGNGGGDHAPAFAPDSSAIAFVRRTAADRSSLCLVDLATWTVTERLRPAGEVDTPRWAPTMDRLLLGLAEPDEGRATLRLASLPLPTGEPNLLWPDQRWQLVGLDVAAAAPAAPTAAAPQLVPVTDADIQIASGSAVFGARSQLVASDGQEFTVYSTTFEGREVAGINCRFELPVARAEDVLELRVRSVARTSRAGPGTMLRMSIYNPVDERFDLCVERPANDTTAQTMQFRTASLRHVTLERHLRVTVIGDVPAGDVAALLVDQVQVEIVTRSAP